MDRRPKLLDLFCGEGGAAVGYARAGFDVTGVDNVNKSRRYPYTFVKADALAFMWEHGREFDAIHASPPCQFYSVTRHSHSSTKHVDLVPATRAALAASGKPYVIENVPGAPLINPVTLCGAAFGLTTTDTDGTPLVLRRHRLFESNIWIWEPECLCLFYKDNGYRIAGAYGGGSATRDAAKERRGGYTPGNEERAALLGVDWMSRHGLSQSIPPAYTQYLGEQLLSTMPATA